MEEKPGLRERKKQQTRLAISQVATRLFIERGFDRVTLAEVAAAAEVSVNTIFNYFTTKEELFFDRGDEIAALPGRIVRERRAGESAAAALLRSLRAAVRGQSGADTAARIKPFLLAIEASPALKARERLLLEQSEALLLQTLLEETGAKAGDPTARAFAAMVTGILWMLIQETRKRLLAGEPEAELRAALLRLCERGFAMLRAGAADYCTRAGRREATEAKESEAPGAPRAAASRRKK